MIILNTICISLGGSVISRPIEPNISYVNGFAKIIKRHLKNYRFVIVVGGGHICRQYINSAKHIIKNNYLLDNIGISATKLNAVFVKNSLAASGLDVYPDILNRIEDLEKATKTKDVVVMGGLIEGITTDAVSSICAKAVNGILVNISTSGYLYDRNPSQKGARMLHKINHDRLMKIALLGDSREPGTNFIFDVEGCRIARKYGIKIHFISDSLSELDEALSGKEDSGTIVSRT